MTLPGPCPALVSCSWCCVAAGVCRWGVVAREGGVRVLVLSLCLGLSLVCLPLPLHRHPLPVRPAPSRPGPWCLVGYCVFSRLTGLVLAWSLLTPLTPSPRSPGPSSVFSPWCCLRGSSPCLASFSSSPAHPLANHPPRLISRRQLRTRHGYLAPHPSRSLVFSPTYLQPSPVLLSASSGSLFARPLPCLWPSPLPEGNPWEWGVKL